MTNVLNFLLFQLGWFAGVGGAAKGMPVFGAAAVIFLVGIHYAFISNDRRRDLRLFAVALVCGWAVDLAQRALGLLDWASTSVGPYCPPPWLWSLWLLFVTTFNASMSWLRGRYLLGAVFGFVGGPLSYWAGVRLGAVTFGHPLLWNMAGIGLVWALVTPFLLHLNDRIRRQGLQS